MKIPQILMDPVCKMVQVFDDTAAEDETIETLKRKRMTEESKTTSDIAQTSTSDTAQVDIDILTLEDKKKLLWNKSIPVQPKINQMLNQLAAFGVRSKQARDTSGLGSDREKFQTGIKADIRDPFTLTDKPFEEITQKHLDKVFSAQVVMDTHDDSEVKEKLILFLINGRTYKLFESDMLKKSVKELQYIHYLLEVNSDVTRKWSEYILKTIKDLLRISGARMTEYTPIMTEDDGREIPTRKNSSKIEVILKGRCLCYNEDSTHPRVIRLGDGLERTPISALRAAIYQIGDTEDEELQQVKAQLLKAKRNRETKLLWRRYGLQQCYKSKDRTIAFTLKGNEHSINCDAIQACLQLPENNTLIPDTNTDVSAMLVSMGYALSPAKLGEDLSIENPTNKLDCWVPEKRVIANLNRANHHSDVPLIYFPIMEEPQVSEVNTFVSTTSQPLVSLQTSVEMASVTMTKQVSTQATKSNILKSKSKKPHSSSSQKGLVSKTTKSKEGSVKGSKIGEGQGEHQRNPKNKESEGAQTVPTAVKDSVNAPSQSQIDVAPINVESQPKSLIIETPQTQNSPTNSLDVDMINTSIPDSPSLTLMEKPKSQANSTVVSTSNSIISTLSTDILHPPTSDCLSTDVLNNNYPLNFSTTISTDVSHLMNVTPPLEISIIVTSADDLVVVQSLLGLREGSELSERLSCSHAKGEEMSDKMHAISSSMARVNERSPTLDDEGTNEECEEPIVSELMDVNEAEKKHLFQQEYQAVLDSFSFEPGAFTHPVPAYQILAEQRNEAAERALNLVHTTAFMLRAKDAINSLPPTVGDDIEFDSGDSIIDAFNEEDDGMDLGGDAGMELRKIARRKEHKTRKNQNFNRRSAPPRLVRRVRAWSGVTASQCRAAAPVQSCRILILLYFEDLESPGANLLRRYNPGVDFSAGRGIVYVPGKDQNETFVPFKSSKGGLTLMLAFVHLLHMRFKVISDFTGRKKLKKSDSQQQVKILLPMKAAIKKMDMQASKEFLVELKEAHEIFGNVDDLLKRRKQGLTEMSGFDDPPGRRNELRNIGGFDPTILSEKYMTEKDDKIRNIDFPKRMQVSFIAMYRKDECPSLFKDPEQLEADGLQNSYDKKPALMWHKLFGGSALTLQFGAPLLDSLPM
ncbi:hypothetical protein AgCh_038785 [Apium graveolens]